MWISLEVRDPIVQHVPTRKSVASFGAVSLSTGQFVRMMRAVFNAETFQTFLKRLVCHQSRGRRMAVVLDNARYHHAVFLAPLLRRHARRLKLLFLPPYSSQLAPIERIWKLARRPVTHNRHFATLPDVLLAVDACFDCWLRPIASCGGYAALLKTLCLIT
jgi:transposase